MTATVILFANTLAEGLMPWPAVSLWQALLYTIIFGVLGILLVAFGFKVFDWLLPKVDVEVELAERHNIAVAIVVAAVVLGISAVIIAAMVG
jgi:putative membrane protein